MWSSKGKQQKADEQQGGLHHEIRRKKYHRKASI